MRELEKKSIKQFDHWANDYDRKYGKIFAEWNRQVIGQMKPKTGESVLDIGCGTGILLEQLLNLHEDLKLTGIDISPNMVKIARKKFAGTKVRIDQGSATQLPYPDNSFDVVTCSSSFHHHPKPTKSLAEMSRVLKPGGRCLILDPYTDGGLRSVICWLIPILFGEKGVKFYSKTEWKRMLEATGFELKNQKKVGYYKLINVSMKKLSLSKQRKLGSKFF